ncbi:hypothetical protein SLEP1_g6087 [Rubroshorea leprosula]|uniref:Uncharacterized protein n=1 Tax=Rubroshorea leprosula TaxID=152421 RepID=A0AAV5I4Q0_9ROSI|nr:hypothetical protein SLEP1_g6087 [Rubroshorea leprosula]
MKNTIRCCIACILPCGALDVIRIVHSNGRVEEISGSIRASDIMKANPKHVLKKPSSSSDDKMVPKIVIVPPDAELQRGKIYFLMPAPPSPSEKKPSSATKKKRRETDVNNNTSSSSGGNDHHHHQHHRRASSTNKNNSISMTNLLVSDQYLSEILSEKISTQRDRRRGRVGVWRPHLESISESPSDA